MSRDRPAAEHFDRAIAHQREGRLDAAVFEYERAITRAPDYVQAIDSLGIALAGLGRYRDALRRFQDVIRLKPDSPSGYNNTAAVLFLLHDPAGASEQLRLALQRDPGNLVILCSLSGTLVDLGNSGEALAFARRAVELHPDSVEAQLALGTALAAAGDYAAAAAVERAAIAVDPDHSRAHANLGNALLELDEIDAARAAYTRAMELGASPGLRLRRTVTTPAIMDSVEQIDAVRRQLGRELDELLEHPVAIGDPLADIGRTNFYLAYHGRSNRSLHEKFAAVCARANPALEYLAAHCRDYAGPGRRIRIGFISKFFFDHSIGRTSLGLIQQLDRSRFEAICLFVPPRRDDAMSRAIAAGADEPVLLPPDLAGARRLIEDLRLDVLFYQDIGMEPFTNFLAHARLAPVQCVSFGHPDTTGIPAMDYFVSSALFELAGAEADYSEKLHLIADVGTLAYYCRPHCDQALFSRRGLGLAPELRLYFCPQALFKIHPEFDVMLRRILASDANSRLLLLEGTSPAWSNRLRKRFAGTLGEQLHKVIFLPRVGSREFTSLLGVADVVLDTPYFNGMNTSLQAFATGRPVVTLPTRLQRGRHTSGMYKCMGLDRAIADTPDHYVDMAVRLAGDEKERRSLSEMIGERAGCLFEDGRVVSGFEAFFASAVWRRHNRSG
jgi:protein O-GlcNAc transferase